MSAAELRRAAEHIRGEDGSPYELGETAVHALADLLDEHARHDDARASAEHHVGLPDGRIRTRLDELAVALAHAILPATEVRYRTPMIQRQRPGGAA